MSLRRTQTYPTIPSSPNMLAPPRKRHRSPSPSADEIPSPLDILLKRRRHDRQGTDDYSPHSQPPWPLSSPETPSQSNTNATAESSSAPWTRLVERRRTKQWERLNAPDQYISQQIYQQTGQRTHEYPRSHFGNDHSSPIRPRWAGGQQDSDYESQSRGATMSSSPVRHQPPSSSPFRPHGMHNQPGQDMEELMDEEEMRREWGAEYADQNSLLHDLVRTFLFEPAFIYSG